MAHSDPETPHGVVHLRPDVEKSFGYAQARRIGNDFFIAGVTSQDDMFEVLHPGDMAAQIGEVYGTISRLLAKEGFSFGDVVEERVFVTDMAAFVAANAVRTEFLAGALPATTAVQVAGLVLPGLVVEVSCMARRQPGDAALPERARVEAVIAAPAATVWEIFRWDNLDGAVTAGLFAGVDYEERRAVPGAIRTVHLAGGGAVRERLEEVDEDGFGYRYRVLNLENFPLADYLGSVSVKPLGEAGCQIVFACEFEPLGITADEWRSLYAVMQQDFIAFVRQRLESRNLEI